MTWSSSHVYTHPYMWHACLFTLNINKCLTHLRMPYSIYILSTKNNTRALPDSLVAPLTSCLRLFCDSTRGDIWLAVAHLDHIVGWLFDGLHVYYSLYHLGVGWWLHFRNSDDVYEYVHPLWSIKTPLKYVTYANSPNLMAQPQPFSGYYISHIHAYIHIYTLADAVFQTICLARIFWAFLNHRLKNIFQSAKSRQFNSSEKW